MNEHLFQEETKKRAQSKLLDLKKPFREPLRTSTQVTRTLHMTMYSFLFQLGDDNKIRTKYQIPQPPPLPEFDIYSPPEQQYSAKIIKKEVHQPKKAYFQSHNIQAHTSIANIKSPKSNKKTVRVSYQLFIPTSCTRHFPVK